MNHEGLIGVTFPSGEHTLRGVFYMAHGEEPKPTALLLHGCPGFEKNLDIAYALREHGWNSLVFHYRGCWGSDGAYVFRTIPDDVSAAIDHLIGGQYACVDPRRLVAIGHSLGGWAATLATARDERLRGAAIYGAAVELGRSVSREIVDNEIAPWVNASADELVAQRAELGDEHRPLAQVARIAPRPLLIIHGDADPYIPAEHARLLYEQASEPRELAIVPGANHSFAWHRHALIEMLWAWLKRCDF